MKKKSEQNLYSKDASFYDLDKREIMKVDIPFYMDHASRIKGDILELACGTGRITIPLANAGYSIWGIELSLEMLKQFKKKLSFLSEEISEKIHLIHTNMSIFYIDRKFPLILLPCRSFQLLYDEEDESSCLKSVYNHLTDDGQFIIDIGDFVGDREDEWVSEEEVFDWENIDSNTGYKVRRTHIKKVIDKNKKIIYPQKTYYILKDDVLIDKIVKISPWKYFSVDQIRDLLISTGFQIIKEMGFYDGTPILEGSEFIFICKKR